MCQLKSAIVLKDRIYCPDHDHHTKMLEELGIADATANAKKAFVRIELLPPNGDMFTDVSLWTLRVDQDIKPEWFFKEVELPKIREAVTQWAKARIFVGVDNLVLSNGAGYCLKDCHNVTLYGISSVGEMCGTSSVGEMYDTSSVGRMCGSSSVGGMCDSSSVGRMCGSSSVGEMCGTSSVGEMCGSSSVGEMCGTSSVGEMCDSSSVGEMCDSSSVLIANRMGVSVSADAILLCDNATIRDARVKTIYQCGDWKLVSI